MGDVAYNTRFSVCNKRYTQDIIIRHRVTTAFKSMHFQIFGQKLLERKLIYAIYNFIVASWCLLFSYGSHLKNTTTKLNGIFFGDVNLAPIGIVIF